MKWNKNTIIASGALAFAVLFGAAGSIALQASAAGQSGTANPAVIKQDVSSGVQNDAADKPDNISGGTVTAPAGGSVSAENGKEVPDGAGADTEKTGAEKDGPGGHQDETATTTGNFDHQFNGAE